MDAHGKRAAHAPLGPVCEVFRASWIDAAGPTGTAEARPAESRPRGSSSAGTHGQTCAACAGWVRTAEAVADALGRPGSVSADAQCPVPAALDARVELELEEPGARFARAFARLAPETAPAALDAGIDALLRPLRIPADLADWERASSVVDALLASRSAPTPPVLDRLVAEELAQPAALSRRYVGGLSPLVAPDALAERLAAAEAARRGWPSRLLAAPVGVSLAAAAALLLLVTVRRAPAAEDAAARPFRVVVVDDPSLLSPEGQFLLSTLAGGVLPGEAR